MSDQEHALALGEVGSVGEEQCVGSACPGGAGSGLSPGGGTARLGELGMEDWECQDSGEEGGGKGLAWGCCPIRQHGSRILCVCGFGG